MKNEKNILWLKEIKNTDFNLVGGKGFNLGKMFQEFTIPNAFCITTNIFNKYVNTKKISKKISKLDLDNFNQVKEKVKKIQEEISNIEFDEEDLNLILENFDSFDNKLVSVRSSGIAEDLPNASFAGQHESFLNVKKENLIGRIIDCFKSLYSLRAIYYRDMKNISQDVSLCVVIQEMVDSDVSGIIHSKNPYTNQKEIMIDVAHGQGELIVSGKIEPDNIIVKKRNKIKYNIGTKKEILTRNGIKENYFSNQRSLNEKQILELVELTSKIVRKFESEQDIEFAIFENKIYVLQSRAITV